MIYVLDSDTLIFLIRGLKKARPSSARTRAERLLHRCRRTQGQGHTVGLSAITVSELEFGARNSGHYDQEIAAVQKIVMPFGVFSYDPVDCPRHYGVIRHALESAGEPIGAMDLLIAAHVLALDGTLVTNNRQHFERVPDLRVVCWT